MSDFSQLPPDLRVPEKETKIPYWSTRGRVIEVQNPETGVELKKEGRVWRRLSAQEIKSGIKVGQYNAVFDQGVNKSIKNSKLVENPAQPDMGAYLEVVEL